MNNAQDGLWESFLCRVRRTGDCWIWTGPLNSKNGYGMVYIMGRARLAHRVAYELWHGPFPKEFDVCHRCDNPPCVKPSHLFLGTALDNMRDKMEKGRWRGGRPKGVKDATKRKTRKRQRLDRFDRKLIRRRLWPAENYAELFGVPVEEILAIQGHSANT